MARTNFAKHYLIINGDTIFEANLKEISRIYFSSKDYAPLIILKRTSLEKNNNRYGGYKETKDGWIYTNEETEFFSLGAFFISYKNLKKRWLLTASQNLDEFEKDSFIKEGFSIDKDCFGREGINAINVGSNIPFIDIGLPNDLERGQDLIPKMLGDII